MKIYYLCLTFDLTPMYVGSTKQKLQTRKENHMSDSRGDTPVKAWIKKLRSLDLIKYLKIVLIEETTKENRYEREIYWTNFYKTKLNYKIGNKHTEEHKNKISKMRKGILLSESTKEKMKAFQKTKAKAVIINNVEYSSINLASMITGISGGLISSVCNKKRFSKKYEINFKHGNG